MRTGPRNIRFNLGNTATPRNQNPAPNPRPVVTVEEHYERLFRFFERVIRWAIGGVTAVAIVAGILFWADRKSMKEDLAAVVKDTRDELKNAKDEIAQLKTDLNQDVREYYTNQTRSWTAEMATEKEMMHQEVNNLGMMAGEQAEAQAMEKIEYVFERDNMLSTIRQMVNDKMDPEIDALVKRGVAKTEEELLQTAIDSLNSKDVYTMSQSIMFIRANTHLKMTDEQVQSVIDFGDRMKSPESFIDILIFQRSPVCTPFFEREFLRGQQNYVFAPVGYFIRNRLEKTLMKLLPEATKNSPLPGDFFRTTALACTQLDKNTAINVLNSKQTVDIVKQLYTEEQWNPYLDNVYNQLIEKVGDSELRDTYCFKGYVRQQN